MSGGAMNEQDRAILQELNKNFGILQNDITHTNAFFKQIVTQNEKEHQDFKDEFKDISNILQQDREAARAQFDRILESFSQIAVLSSKVSEVSKILEDRRGDTKELFNKTTELKSDLDGVAAKFSKALTEKADSETVDHLKEKVDRAMGAGMALNYLITIGLTVVGVIVGSNL